MPDKKTDTKKTDSKSTSDRLEAAKAKADTGAPPAKRATRLAYPELADEGWLRGNPEAAKKLET